MARLQWEHRMPDMNTAFGIIAVVLGVSALASGLVERAPLSFPMLFLAWGCCCRTAAWAS